ncbi:MAG: hypothetical protein Q9195_000962 [Heterodermia aff. obscurata]
MGNDASTLASNEKGKAALYEITDMPPSSDNPVVASFDSEHLTVGAGVAIFHIASSRVVVCYHTMHGYWFLPKGRRDVNEETSAAAEREGFEESGYRNRLLPIVQRHRQPQAYNPATSSLDLLSKEPVWMQLVPVSRTSQYVLFWYIAETIPPGAETSVPPRAEGEASPYQRPPPFPVDLSLAQRIQLEPEGYEPIRHEDTGVNSEEAQYTSYLLPIPEAMKKLQGNIMADVVRKGWEGIEKRREMEEKAAKGASNVNSN